MRRSSVDKPFLIIFLILLVGGFFVFLSASMGLVARDGAKFGTVAMRQALLGLAVGGVAFALFYKTDYKFWKKHCFAFFILAAFFCFTVFIPGLGMSHGGATRWIKISFITFQPAELFKIAFIIYFAAWLGAVKQKVRTFSWGLLPFIILVGIAAVVLLVQPDTDTLAVIFLSALGMYVVAGARWRHIAFVFVTSLAGLAILAFFRPYVMQRLTVFFNPSADPQGAGYQVQQSLIAIGSGGLTGRGFGQSIQKFSYLPEPVGDSIFAVAAEEFGFIGASLMILAYALLALRGLKIAKQAPDAFSGLIVTGIVILIAVQSFVNIASMLALVPLSGIPLLFVSQGGTALMMVLAEVGLVLNISRRRVAERVGN